MAKTQQRTTDYLDNAVAQGFIQPGDKLLQGLFPFLFIVFFQILHNLVDGLGMKTCSPANAGGVVHNNKGKDKR